MNTLGLVFILGSVLLMRQVVTGRVKETPQDIRDIFLNTLSGDTSALKSTLAQRGNNAAPDVAATVAAGTSGADALSGLLLTPAAPNSDLLAEVIKLGQSAKGYQLGGTGPDYYDCSGLVWKAMTTLGMYTGPRFTTHNYVQSLGTHITQVQTPAAGDVVLWDSHMGVVDSRPDSMFSAMSPAAGIGFGSISGSNKYFQARGEAPAKFYRYGKG